MEKDITISVFEIVGSPLCVASDDGQKVYDRLRVALIDEHKVKLSFHNVELLTSAFLNSAIGQLYGEFNEEKIRTLLDVKEITPSDIALLKRVISTAKEYFKAPRVFEQSLKNGLEENEEYNEKIDPRHQEL